jgi:NADPH-dependent 2,4-dienoyl-CoA reductase/sulfur reductase-like enzyme/peroxiredoxin family protein/rhodanese-related sulfurtransferase/TusA-related sulfurtransferase
MNKKILIIGGVAGGASTAARLRRNDENAEIILFERGEYISFANCGLPYYIGGAIEQRDALLVQTPEDMNARFNIDVRVQNEVMSIDKENKKIIVRDLKNNKEYEEAYDKLVLSPGSTPLVPPIPGIDGKNIFTLWTIPDTDEIKSFIDDETPKSAIVVGGGFIGIEMAENLHELGLHVTIVEMQNQVMAPVDFEIAQDIHRHLKSKNVNLILEDGVKTFEDSDGKKKITLQSGKTVSADMVMLSIGVKPNSKLAKDADLEVNQRGGIVVNEYLQTSDENIYALGDAIEVTDHVDGSRAMIPLAGPANKQGRIVANNLCGAKEKYKGTQGTSIAKVFDLTVASTGNNEKLLVKKGLEYKKDFHVSIIHSKSNASYYPGAIPMVVKTIFNNDGKVLGAQIVGYSGVDKRIDVFATAIRANMTVYDLKELELAYAPPFASAKEAVNMAGFVGENILENKIKVFNWNEFDKIDDSYVILDIREEEELDLGLIKGSVHIPLDDLRNRLDELDKNKKIVAYCAIGIRGYIAGRILMQNGFTDVYNLNGGYNTFAAVYCQEDDSKCGGIAYDSSVDFDEFGNLESNESVESNKTEDLNFNISSDVIQLNACGLSCPGPIMKVSKSLKAMKTGEVVKVRTTDPGFIADIGSWCKRTNNTLLNSGKENNEFIAVIGKGSNVKMNVKKETQLTGFPTDKTMVVFSGDMDKAIASLIIANGALAMDRKVTMFFTFWGLNVLRKPKAPKVKKNFIEKMFGIMMPTGIPKLKLSNMNMFGIGPKMIKGLMTKHNVPSLQDLLQAAIDNGAEIIACQMSMDLMGIKKEELLDGVNIGGVANYLDAAEDAGTNLFI